MNYAKPVLALGIALWAVPVFAAPPVAPNSSAYANAFGPFVGGGQTSQVQTQIRNGVVGETYDTTGGSTRLEAASANNTINHAQVVTNSGNVASTTANLRTGSVHASSTLGNGAVTRAFASGAVGDTVNFINSSGTTAYLPFSFGFSGQYAGATNSTAYSIFSIQGARGACVAGNYEGQCAGFGPFYTPPAPRLASNTNIENTLIQGYLKNGSLVQFGAQQGGAFFFGSADNLSNDYTLTRSFNASTGALDSIISATLAVPTGVSRLGFTLRLDLDCSGAGSSCDFGHTSNFGFGALPEGLSFTSESGGFLAGPISAVPEPATWAMMIFGFGIVGGAMRVRRRNVVLA